MIPLGPFLNEWTKRTYAALTAAGALRTGSRTSNWPLVAVVVICLFPLVVNLSGVSFGTVVTGRLLDQDPVLTASVSTLRPPEETNHPGLRRVIIYTLWQWTGVCLAVLTAVASILQFFVKRDSAIPVLGAALFFCGCLQACQILSATDVIAIVVDHDNFLPFTSAMTSLFHATILAIGTTIALKRDNRRGATTARAELRFVALVGMLFGVAAYGLIHLCARSTSLPIAIFPSAPIPRPYEALALVVFLFAGGILLPRLMQKSPSLFTYGLLLSLVPSILSQAYLAFGSKQDFDNAFTIAQYLNLISYLIPFTGLLIDYVRAAQADVQLRATEQQLALAREIQRGLLPEKAPVISGYDIAGMSLSPEAVGGDYFDYLQLPKGAWGLVVADVSGHDLGASILMSQTRAYLRAEAVHTSDPGVIVTGVNRFIGKDLRDRRFVSLFLAQLNPVKHEITYSAAGHAGYLIRQNGEWLTLNSTGPLLGILADRSIAVGSLYQLAPGDLLVLITDGVVEATSTTGEQFSLERTIEVLKRSAGQTAAERVENLLAEVRQHIAPASLADDFTVVLLTRQV